MSSSGVKVKQQLFCTLNILVKNGKGTSFCFLVLPISLINVKLFNTKPLQEIKMLEENKIFFLTFLTPEKSNAR